MSSHSYEERKCVVCDKKFRVRKDAKTVTCSYECMSIMRRIKAGLYRYCKNCGKFFRAYKQSTLFCSNKCGCEYVSRDKNQIVSCDFCGKEFKKPNCHVRINNFCSKKCLHKWRAELYSQNPCDHPNWRGGISNQGGYIFKRMNDGSYKQEHRIVMENHLGRDLSPDEIVHHVDGNKTNNDINNLQLVTRAEHIEIHRDEFKRA